MLDTKQIHRGSLTGGAWTPPAALEGRLKQCPPGADAPCVALLRSDPQRTLNVAPDNQLYAV